MKFNDLKVSSKKSAKRVGRGIAAGQGKTAGRGTKGQNSRTGGRVRPGFEGGQNPLYKRLPKLPGFTSHRPKAENVYTGQLDTFAGKTVDNFTLANAGLVSNPYTKVKLILKGEVTKKVTVKLQGASESAAAAVQKAGGTFAKVEQVKRQPKEKAVEKK
ncbi:MAG TPA: 50S ribosomal protein L15 [Candidatus Limnocylindria bacterium]|nr:50S ribosomal protein L15 [Candidatus Limnocylindria bacterium]